MTTHASPAHRRVALRALLTCAMAASSAAFGASGCGAPETALVVFVDSDLPLDRIEVEVRGAGGVMGETAVTMDFPDADRPVWVSLVPDDGHVVGTPFEVRVVGYYADDATPVIERTAVTAFVDEEILSIALYLYDVCQSDTITCPSGETCVPAPGMAGGTCASNAVTGEEYVDDPAPI